MGRAAVPDPGLRCRKCPHQKGSHQQGGSVEGVGGQVLSPLCPFLSALLRMECRTYLPPLCPLLRHRYHLPPHRRAQGQNWESGQLAQAKGASEPSAWGEGPRAGALPCLERR